VAFGTSIPMPASETAAPTRAFWSVVDAAAMPASTLITLAVLVRALSPVDYGMLVVALAISGLSMAVNPAIATTTTKFVSEFSGKGHSAGWSAAGVITVSLTAVAVVDLTLFLGIAAFREPISRWIFGANVIGTPQAVPALMFAVLSVGIQQLETVLAAAIRGLQRFRRQALIEVMSRAALAAVVAVVAWRTRSVEAVLLSQCLVYAASTLVRAAALRGLLPNERLLDLSGWTHAGKLFRYGGWMWLAALAGVAYTNADRVIIARIWGLAAAGQYNVFVQITQLIHFIPSSAFAFSLPVFSRLAAEGHSHRAQISRAYRSYSLAIGLVALLIAAAMMAAWPFLLAIVAGAAGAAGRFGTAGLLALNFLLLALNVAPYYLLLALGRATAVSVITTISMLVALLLMMILIPRYGMTGAAIARLAYGVGALMLLRTGHRLLESI
jgi:O-antigen/teichoic acid export membrane protein